MANPITTDSLSPFIVSVGGRHRVEAPIAAVHEVLHQALAWALWVGAVTRWLAAWAAYRADVFEAWALKPTRFERAVVTFVRRGATILMNEVAR